MATPDFLIKVKSLEVSVSIISEVPSGQVPVWDFGVNAGITQDTTHTYEVSGRYLITLKLVDAETQTDVIETVVKPVMVSEYVSTQLTDTIYNLIDGYIPSDLQLELTSSDKAAFINKWQLYIQPLVNHCIPLEEYNNEAYYEGLENQLIMEMAVYDYLYRRIEVMLMETANSLEKYNAAYEHTTTSGEARDRIKQITTGPTEVQYYDTITDSVSGLFKAYSQATQPGGVLDDLRLNLCMLASRLEIFLPICTAPKRIKVPKVVNHRRAGLLGGPNPGFPVKKPTDKIL